MKNILTKEEFIKILDSMEKVSDFDNKVSEVYYKSGFDVTPPMNPSLESELLTTLNRMFKQEETDFYTDIEYYVLELDYGKAWKPGMVKYNGEEIDLSDAGKLYDHLIRLMNEFSEDINNDNIEE